MTTSKDFYKKTPTVFQMEASECSAACLSMILKYYGKHVPLEKLRVEAGISRDGCTAKYLIIAAKKFGLTAKGKKRPLELLINGLVPVPCIIHWNFNHFVVFEGKKGKYFYINDPAVGRRRLTKEELDFYYTGVTIELSVSEDFIREKQNSSLVKLVSGRIKGKGKDVCGLFLTGILKVLQTLGIPLFLKLFIDEVLAAKNASLTSALLVLMAVMAIFSLTISWTQGKILNRLEEKLSVMSSYNLLEHMLRLPVDFFDQRDAGELAGRIESNENISSFLVGKLADSILNLFMSIIYLIILFVFSPVLALVSIVNLVISVSALKLNDEYMSDASVKMKQDRGKLSGTVIAGIRLNETLKASGAENAFVSRVLGQYAKVTDIEQGAGRIQQILNSIPEISGSITMIVSLVIGSMYVMNGKFSAGLLVAVIVIQILFETPARKLVSFFEEINTLKADLLRVDDLEKYEQDIRFSRDAIKYEKGKNRKLSGRVELKNISYGYSRLKSALIEDVSLSLECGKSVAFCGMSGSGKSTVAKIVSGLYEPWTGEVLFDGVNALDIDRELINASIATVSQESNLFTGTIRDNITMWNPAITEEDMIKAAKDACIHEVITKKEEAYDYMLSEGGANLSGGQRQRIEIARALAINPSILIMDEATSALDPITEKLIIDNIKRRGCTCIMVAHRLSAIRDCDEIVIMSSGKITERGTHEQLIMQDGLYGRLVSTV